MWQNAGKDSGKRNRGKAAGLLTDRKGFTLIEVMLATAMVSIFFTMAALIVPTWYRAYARSVQINYARQIADSLMGTIEGQIRFANKLEVIAPTEADSVERLTGVTGSSRFYIPMKESTNLIDGLVYDEDYFLNHDVRLSFELAADKSSCEVTVEIVEQNGETLLKRTRAVLLSGENP